MISSSGKPSSQPVRLSRHASMPSITASIIAVVGRFRRVARELALGDRQPRVARGAGASQIDAQGAAPDLRDVGVEHRAGDLHRAAALGVERAAEVRLVTVLNSTATTATIGLAYSGAGGVRFTAVKNFLPKA